jgi:hypothetical protein
MIHKLLADAMPQLPPPESYQSIGWIVAVFLGLCVGIYYLLEIIAKLRGKSPQPPNKQLDSAQKDLERRVNMVEGAIIGVRKEMADSQEKIEVSARSRSNGIYAKIEDVRHELSAAQESTRSEMHRGFQDIERTLGRLEGKLEK